MSSLVITVNANIKDPERMMDRAWEAVSGPSMEMFLRGPAHEYLENEIVQRFDYEGDKKSGNWPPLSDATQNIRARLGYSTDEINIRSGEMFETLTHDADYAHDPSEAIMILPGSAGQHEPMRSKLLTAAQGRQTNPHPNFGPTPARPVLAVDDTDLEAILVAFSEWFVAEMAGGII